MIKFVITLTFSKQSVWSRYIISHLKWLNSIYPVWNVLNLGFMYSVSFQMFSAMFSRVFGSTPNFLHTWDHLWRLFISFLRYSPLYLTLMPALFLFVAPEFMLCLQGGKFDQPDRLFNRCIDITWGKNQIRIVIILTD